MNQSATTQRQDAATAQYTPLHHAVLAARNADELAADSAVHDWLEKPAIDIRDPFGRTAFHLACCLGHHESVPRYLLDAGASPTIPDNEQWQPGHAAVVRQSSAGVLAWLIEAQILLPTAPGPRGWPPLHGWAAHGRFAVGGKTLLKAGVDVNTPINRTEKVTALHIAARFTRYPDIISTLLEAGADGRRRDQYGRTAYDMARIVESTPERATVRWQRTVTQLYDAANGGSGGRWRSFGPALARRFAGH